MRFITEFEIMEYEKNKYHVIDNRRSYYERKLSPMIVSAFGWQNPVNNNPLHHRFEIEAFPMDKWIEFKNRLMAHLHYCDEHDELPDALAVLRLIKELEFFNSNETKKPG